MQNFMNSQAKIAELKVFVGLRIFFFLTSLNIMILKIVFQDVSIFWKIELKLFI